MIRRVTTKTVDLSSLGLGVTKTLANHVCSLFTFLFSNVELHLPFILLVDCSEPSKAYI